MKKNEKILLFWFMILIMLLLFFATVIYSQSKYELPAKQYILDYSKDTLIAQIGIQELTGNNDGYCEVYLASVNLKKGNPYCAAGQYYCFYINALNKKDIPIYKTGIANKHYTYAKFKGVKIPYKAKDNDLIIWRKKNSWQGHIERIIKVGKKGWVDTIGFNTGSGREGNSVLKRKRNIKHPIGRMLIRGLIGFSSDKNNYKGGCNLK